MQHDDDVDNPLPHNTHPCDRTSGQKFTEPVALSSTNPTNLRLAPTALGSGFGLLTLRARCKRQPNADHRGGQAQSQRHVRCLQTFVSGRLRNPGSRTTTRTHRKRRPGPGAGASCRHDLQRLRRRRERPYAGESPREGRERDPPRESTSPPPGSVARVRATADGCDHRPFAPVDGRAGRRSADARCGNLSRSEPPQPSSRLRLGTRRPPKGIA